LSQEWAARLHPRRPARRWGTGAANALDRFIAARIVTCTERDRDRYGRVVAVCKVAGDDISAWLVRQGWALDYARYSGGTYANHQSQARSERRGVWQGEFEAPWEWRQP
jgi:endonuclease YncB( thermonuclease family)